MSMRRIKLILLMAKIMLMKIGNMKKNIDISRNEIVTVDIGEDCKININVDEKEGYYTNKKMTVKLLKINLTKI